MKKEIKILLHKFWFGRLIVVEWAVEKCWWFKDKSGNRINVWFGIATSTSHDGITLVQFTFWKLSLKIGK